MSDTGSQNVPVWQRIGAVIAEVGPVLTAIIPAEGAAIAVAVKIAQGVVGLVPAAVALYNQIMSGTPPTAAQLQALEDADDASYVQLKADIATAIAALPAA